VTSKVLDRESVSEYTVVLVCRDFGRPPMSTSVLFDVVVIDTNDNPPVFLSDIAFQTDAVDVTVTSGLVTYVAELFENNFIGAFVAQVKSQAPTPWGRSPPRPKSCGAMSKYFAMSFFS